MQNKSNKETKTCFFIKFRISIFFVVVAKMQNGKLFTFGWDKKNINITLFYLHKVNQA